MESSVPHESHEAFASTTPDDVIDDGSEKSLPSPAPVNSAGFGMKVQRTGGVRRRRGTIITDGPFAETKEVVGGVMPPNGIRR
jgi:hypothetical protein